LTVLQGIQSSKPELIRRSEGNYELITSTKYTVDRIKVIEEKISECLEELQGELTELA
jgi:hypothetical protein